MVGTNLQDLFGIEQKANLLEQDLDQRPLDKFAVFYQLSSQALYWQSLPSFQCQGCQSEAIQAFIDG